MPVAIAGKPDNIKRDWHAGWRKDGHHASDDAVSAILGRGAPAYLEKDHTFV